MKNRPPDYLLSRHEKKSLNKENQKITREKVRNILYYGEQIAIPTFIIAVAIYYGYFQ